MNIITIIFIFISNFYTTFSQERSSRLNTWCCPLLLFKQQLFEVSLKDNSCLAQDDFEGFSTKKEFSLIFNLFNSCRTDKVSKLSRHTISDN